VILALLAGLALRLWLLERCALVDGDSLIYGDIARNLLLHHAYALSAPAGIAPTLIRLPGYPLLLAACFRMFGIANWAAVLRLQVALDLGTCLLLAAFVWLTAGRRPARWALWLAALCPFTANYTALPLAETPTLFAISAALLALAWFYRRPGPGPVVVLAAALGCAALLRPDGALLAVALWPALLAAPRSLPIGRRRALGWAGLCALLCLLPFAFWAARNWRVFHIFAPLASRAAADPGEATYPGFERWFASWCVDFASTYEVYWNVPGAAVDLGSLPSRAFDGAAQYRATADLLRDYNARTELTVPLDARFAALAAERVAASPLRYYLALPAARLADMWLRPRIEATDLNVRWWQWRLHPRDFLLASALAALNLALIAFAIRGWARGARFRGVLAAYMLLRSALLWTVAAPETRYTLECMPMLLALAAIGLGGGAARKSRGQRAPATQTGAAGTAAGWSHQP